MVKPSIDSAVSTNPDKPQSEVDETDSRSLWPDMSLLGVALIWGFNIPIMKDGLANVEPFAFNALRLTLSALVLALLAWRETAPAQPVPPGHWKQVVLYAIVASGAYQILFLLGVSRTSTGNGSLIMATVPMWTALIARVLLGDRLPRLAKLGLGIAFSGTLTVALEKGVSGETRLLSGNLYMLVAALAWALATVQSRKVLPHVSPLRLSAISSVSMLPIQFAFATTTLSSIFPHLTEVKVSLSMIYAGVLSTGLALPMWSFGVRHAGAAQAAVFQNLVPIIAIASAWAWRGEAITVNQILGGALILGGLVLVRRSRQ